MLGLESAYGLCVSEVLHLPVLDSNDRVWTCSVYPLAGKRGFPIDRASLLDKHMLLHLDRGSQVDEICILW
jgi:hypothetical protein